jgi:peptidoglycan glycosyltransferase
VCPTQITLQNALKVSCNTAFSRYGVEGLGADKLKAVAQSFGFETAPTFDRDEQNVMQVTERPHRRHEVTRRLDRPPGAGPVVHRPARGPVDSAAGGAGGRGDRQQRHPDAPYLIDTIQDANLKAMWHVDPKALRTPVTPSVAGQLRQMMESVVAPGRHGHERADRRL